MSEAKEYKYVGTRRVRPDGYDKVTGRANYGADLALPGMIWGKILRSPHAHAKINGIDTGKAEAYPGVSAVVTFQDFPEKSQGIQARRTSWPTQKLCITDMPLQQLQPKQSRLRKRLWG